MAQDPNGQVLPTDERADPNNQPSIEELAAGKFDNPGTEPEVEEVVDDGTEEVEEVEEITDEPSEDEAEDSDESSDEQSDEEDSEEDQTEEEEEQQEVVEGVHQEVVENVIEPDPEPELDIEAETEGVFSTVQEMKEYAALLKDDYFKKIADYFKSTGDIKPFLVANSVDFNNMSDLEIMRYSYYESTKDLGLSEEEFQVLFQDEVASKYTPKKNEEGEEDSDDVQRTKLRLKVDAAKKRKEFIATQQQFMAPAREEQPKQTEQDRLRAENEQRKLAAKSLSTVVKNGKVSIEIGDNISPAQIPVEPSSIVERAVKPAKLLEALYTKDGKLNWDLFAKINLLIDNEDALFGGIVNQAKSSGKKQLVDKVLKNKTPKPKGKSPKNAPPKDLDPYSVEGLKNMRRVLPK